MESGLDYRGARFYDADIGRFLSLDPLAMDYPALSDYVYVAGNPIMFVDPTGKSVDDIYIDTDGNYLGEDGNTDDNTIRVVEKSTWDLINSESGPGANSVVGTAVLQNANFSTPLVGVSETQPGYQKAISISSKTWGKIESAGGEQAVPNLLNVSGEDAYFRGEGKMSVGPGALGSSGNPRKENGLIKSGEAVYGGVDGVKTELESDKVFKLSDGNRAVIISGGRVLTTTKKNQNGIMQSVSSIAQAADGGWQNMSNNNAFKNLQKQKVP